MRLVLDATPSSIQSTRMSDTPIEDQPKANAGVNSASPSETREFLVFLVKLGLFMFVLRSFIFAPFSIPSESMLPRLMVGDYLVVAKWPYGFSRHSLPLSVPLIPGRVLASLPERGDVAVFKAPPGNNVDYIKRVIGLPGDRVQMRSGQLFLNGKAIPKVRMPDLVVPVSPNTRCIAPEFEHQAPDGTATCHYPRFAETLPSGRRYAVLDLGETAADTSEVFVVPEGHVFMMGDNRDNSLDSRFPAEEGGGIGFVPVSNLVGRATISVFSTDGSSNWLLPWTWVTAARWGRIGDGF